eukprot:TRINITY_DN25161_c0_g1_i1.p2 TRINITY_DN25161_c0_g1~~TRINITY_DN25161_c0_g1_i1.p2  ORF type:complete len:162 (+),score=27.96 TRINITY_DN25161_c0_g1_i1:195-680(+)
MPLQPLDPEEAGRELQHYLTALNAPKHVSRERALKSFKAFVEVQGNEFYDDDVDTWFKGDGYMHGLLAWCGESSTGTEGGLKRTAATAIKTLGWLVHRKPERDAEDEEVSYCYEHCCSCVFSAHHCQFDAGPSLRIECNAQAAWLQTTVGLRPALQGQVRQ